MTKSHIQWNVSVILTTDRRIGSSDLIFDTHSQARRWCNGEKIRGHPNNVWINDRLLKEFRLSRTYEIHDDDIETIIPMLESQKEH